MLDREPTNLVSVRGLFLFDNCPSVMYCFSMKTNPIKLKLGITQHMREIFEAIDKERQRQDEKWGTVQEHPLVAWVLIAQMELAEAAQGIDIICTRGIVDAGHAASKYFDKCMKDKNQCDVRQELLHVAAVCVAALEQHS